VEEIELKFGLEKGIRCNFIASQYCCPKMLFFPAKR